MTPRREYPGYAYHTRQFLSFTMPSYLPRVHPVQLMNVKQRKAAIDLHVKLACESTHRLLSFAPTIVYPAGKCGVVACGSA